jgi:hypothetical protein
MQIYFGVRLICKTLHKRCVQKHERYSEDGGGIHLERMKKPTKTISQVFRSSGCDLNEVLPTFGRPMFISPPPGYGTHPYSGTVYFRVTSLTSLVCRKSWGLQYNNRSLGSSVSIVSDYELDERGSIPERGRGFFLYLLRPDRLLGPPSLQSN